MNWAWPFRRGSRPDRDVPWIEPELGDPDGLIGVGGDLSPAMLLRAYSEGVFPWFSSGDPVLWWSPDPRAIIELDGVHVSRRLARTIRSGKFRVTVDQCFESVMRSCGANRPEGTWVTGEMVAGYTALHRAGHAHSVEVWCQNEPRGREGESSGHFPATISPKGREGESTGPNPLPTREVGAEPGEGSSWLLAGGIYGVSVGGLFAGESMFHRVTDASKVALVALVERLIERGYVLFDVQMTTEHTERFGAVNITRDEYLRRLREAVRIDVRFDG